MRRRPGEDEPNEAVEAAEKRKREGNRPPGAWGDDDGDDNPLAHLENLQVVRAALGACVADYRSAVGLSAPANLAALAAEHSLDSAIAAELDRVDRLMPDDPD